MLAMIETLRDELPSPTLMRMRARGGWRPDRRHTRNVLDFRLEQMQNVTQETGVRAVQGSNRYSSSDRILDNKPMNRSGQSCCVWLVAATFAQATIHYIAPTFGEKRPPSARLSLTLCRLEN